MKIQSKSVPTTRWRCFQACPRSLEYLLHLQQRGTQRGQAGGQTFGFRCSFFLELVCSVKGMLQALFWVCSNALGSESQGQGPRGVMETSRPGPRTEMISSWAATGRREEGLS